MRAQIQTAVGMILTLTIVAAVLVLGTWGFIEISRSVSSGTYDRFYSSFEEASVNYRSFGTLEALRIAPPEAFCVFNTTATDKTCIKDYSGYEQCETQEGYWDAAGASDGNVVFEDGRNERIEDLYPRNGRYACFGPTARVAFIEGRGSYVTVSPMRELESFTLSDGALPPATPKRVDVAFFTSQPQREASPELFYVYNESAEANTDYSRSGMSYDLGPAELNEISLELTTDKVVTNLVLNVNIGSFADTGIEVPQQP